MAEKANETDELLKEALAELKAINERNKKLDEEEARKNRRLEITDAEFVFLLFGVVIGFLAQIFYDYYGSLFPNSQLWKLIVGLGIALFLMGSIIVYDRIRKKRKN